MNCIGTNNVIQGITDMEARIPKVGEVLVHRFRQGAGEVQAAVVSVDQETRSVVVEVDGKEYPSLSAAASAIMGTSQNGWVYWGLKKQKASPRRQK